MNEAKYNYKFSCGTNRTSNGQRTWPDGEREMSTTKKNEIIAQLRSISGRKSRGVDHVFEVSGSGKEHVRFSEVVAALPEDLSKKQTPERILAYYTKTLEDAGWITKVA